jgi:hypothetical protein
MRSGDDGRSSLKRFIQLPIFVHGAHLTDSLDVAQRGYEMRDGPLSPYLHVERNAVFSWSPLRPGGPKRHWRSYGNDPLPLPADALDEPFAAFPSWFMRVTCERCRQERMFSEVHSAQRGMRIRDILDKMGHNGCGGRAGKEELITGVEGVNSRPVRRIVLREGGRSAGAQWTHAVRWRAALAEERSHLLSRVTEGFDLADADSVPARAGTPRSRISCDRPKRDGHHQGFRGRSATLGSRASRTSRPASNPKCVAN